MTKITVTKRIHKVWEEYMTLILPKFPEMLPIMNKYQYIYDNGKQKISLVSFHDRMYGKYKWEILQVDGKPSLFDYVERFPTKKLAIKRIRELLE